MNPPPGLALVSFLLICRPAAAFIEMNVSLESTSTTSLRARGEVYHTDMFGNPSATDITMTLWIRNSALLTVASSGTIHDHADSRLTSLDAAGLPADCYRARLAASDSDGYGNEVGTAETCLQPTPACPGDPTCPAGPPPCAPSETDPCTGGGAPRGGGAIRDCSFYDPLEPTGCQSPILLNLDDGSYALTSAADGVSFDIDGDGQLDRVAWTNAGSRVAFLALDRDGNGTIDGASELFGNHTLLANGHPAADGFHALAALDVNNDGILDSADAVWPSLLLWIDANHNGVSERQELTPIVASTIESLDLSAHWTGRVDRNGNLYRFEAGYRRSGTTRRYYDVYLRALH